MYFFGLSGYGTGWDGKLSQHLPSMSLGSYVSTLKLVYLQLRETEGQFFPLSRMRNSDVHFFFCLLFCLVMCVGTSKCLPRYVPEVDSGWFPHWLPTLIFWNGNSYQTWNSPVQLDSLARAISKFLVLTSPKMWLKAPSLHLAMLMLGI